jgi:hypothetical protein
MDLYSYINNYSQNKTSLEIPKLVFHQAHLVKYLSVVGQDWDPFHDYSRIFSIKRHNGRDAQQSESLATRGWAALSNLRLHSFVM